MQKRPPEPVEVRLSLGKVPTCGRPKRSPEIVYSKKSTTSANISLVCDMHLCRCFFCNYSPSPLFKCQKATLNSSSSLTESWLPDGPCKSAVRANKPSSAHVTKNTEVFQGEHLGLVCSKTPGSCPCCSCVLEGRLPSLWPG